MSSISALRFSDFTALPYHVQERIVDLIDHYNTYLSLALACKYLSELCTRSLYHRLEFSALDVGKKRWPKSSPTSQFNYVRMLQYQCVQTLEAKPELAAFTRHLTWDMSDDKPWAPAQDTPVSRAWTTFEALTLVRTLSLRVSVASYTSEPPNPLFPHLVRAQVEGIFPQGALQRILFTSPYIKHLTIAPDTKEYMHQPEETCAHRTGIEPFLRDSISKQVFCGLRTLDVGFNSDVDPDLAKQFIEMSAEQMEELWIDCNFGRPRTGYELWVVPMLATRKWRRLRTLGLPKLILPNEPEKYLEKYCPMLSLVTSER